MIVKSNTSVETNSIEVEDLCTFLAGLSLPEGAKLKGIQEKVWVPSMDAPTPPVEVTYILNIEWEVEV